ncbi:MAG TPA: serine/threonine-protein kinase [Acidobacteriaceae bacterium]|jgi:serine/threonine protein kinase|nr:serine/threonine-protein kinase [Acidobacteriaceae bacterium]
MQPPTLFDSENPQTIGPFRIVRVLGVGGMGAVYLAERTEQFSQQVAIKILHPHLFPADATAKLEREGQMLAALQHPGIVGLLDIGVTESGLRYMVMDYVEGLAVDAYCDSGRLSLRARIAILRDICEAVEHAHRHLVVHADLKPENILVTSENKPRLLDFGVATLLTGFGASPFEPQSSSPSSSPGDHTALYASPEQRRGERLTIASDIYSLGLIAQSLLAGIPPEPPNEGILNSAANAGLRTSVVKRLRALDTASQQRIAEARQATPASLLTTLEGDLEAILNKALQLNAAERFESAQELRDEFDRYLLGYPIATRPSSFLSRFYKWVLRNKLAAALGFVFVLAVLFSIAGVVHQATEASRKRLAAQNRLHELVRLTDLLAGDLYESVHGLQGSEAAQSALLLSAHQTIDKLAADDGRDPQLDLELAREYEKLARLELGRTPLTADAIRQASQDLDSETAMLDRLDRDSAHGKSNSESARLRRSSRQLMEQNALTKQAH